MVVEVGSTNGGCDSSSDFCLFILVTTKDDDYW